MNEPDLDTQSNLTAGKAATIWKANLEPYAKQDVKLVSPAITNGGGTMGAAWLQAFLQDECKDCTVDAIAVHWYDSATNVAYFTSYLTELYATFGLPIWLTEKKVTPWLEKQLFIERYAAFEAFEGTFVSKDGSLTELGTTYKNTV